MRAVVTRVNSATVRINGETVGSIGRGFLILLGVHIDDTSEQCEKLCDKILSLRIFEDDSGKMNRSLEDERGEVMVVSQFTLYGNCRRGRRPEFLKAARPETAVPLYEMFVRRCRDRGFHTETGVFGADMKVESINDGPVTLIIDTDEL